MRVRNDMKIALLIPMAMVLATSTLLPGQELSKKKSNQANDFKELQAFHNALHPLVHDALPRGNFDRIRAGLNKLLQKATAIQKAKLPARLSGRQEDIQERATYLHDLLAEMVAMKDKIDDTMMEKTFNEMRETFEEIVEIDK